MTHKRTDIHRPSTIVPADYEHVLSYNGGTTENGWPVPSFGINCELDRRKTTHDADGKIAAVENGKHSPDGLCCVLGLLHEAKVTMIGNTCQCTVCGTCFVYGEVWQHRPSGEYIHIGHICGAKYGLMVDRSAFELKAGRARAAAAKQIQREMNTERRADFLIQHPGLGDALDLDHPILADMKARFQQYCKLSDKQVAFAFKLADEIRNPKPKEAHVPAPIGKQTFRGRVVSTKAVDNGYGVQIKATIKVQGQGGCWLAWGTAPKALLDLTGNHGGLRGCEVEITTTLQRSDRDDHFAFMRRPRGRLLDYGAEHQEAECIGCLREKAVKA